MSAQPAQDINNQIVTRKELWLGRRTKPSHLKLRIAIIMLAALLGLAVFGIMGRESKGERMNKREESLTVVRLVEEFQDISIEQQGQHHSTAEVVSTINMEKVQKATIQNAEKTQEPAAAANSSKPSAASASSQPQKSQKTAQTVTPSQPSKPSQPANATSAPSKPSDIVTPQQKIPFTYVFPLSKSSNMSVMFLTCCGRHQMLEETVSAFIKLNQYPLKRLIILNDGPSSPILAAVTDKFPNATLLCTGEKGGQLRAIDLGLKLVDTAYIYYSQDDRKLIKQGLLSYNVRQLQKDKKLLQTWNTHHHQVPYNLTADNVVDPNWGWSGFSFYPTVWRMEDYYMLKGGFSGYTNDTSYGQGAGVAEYDIIQFYRRLGLYVRESTVQYHENLGLEKGLPRA